MVNLDGCEADTDFTLLDGLFGTLYPLEVDDGETSVAVDSTHLLGHENALDLTEFFDDFGCKLFFGHHVWDFRQSDTLGVRDFLDLLLILNSLSLGLDCLGIELPLFGCADGSLLTSIVIFSLVFLKHVKVGLEFIDLHTLGLGLLP